MKGKSKRMALVRSFEQRCLKWPQSQGKGPWRPLSVWGGGVGMSGDRHLMSGDRRQAEFILELPRSPYQDQNLAPTPKVAWPEDDFHRYFYSSRRIHAAWHVFKCSLEESMSNSSLRRFTALLVSELQLCSLGMSSQQVWQPWAFSAAEVFAGFILCPSAGCSLAGGWGSFSLVRGLCLP